MGGVSLAMSGQARPSGECCSIKGRCDPRTAGTTSVQVRERVQRRKFGMPVKSDT